MKATLNPASGALASEHLLTFEQVAAIFHTTKRAVREMIYREDSGPEELPAVLRRCLVSVSPKRRYIKAKPFYEWLRSRIA